MAASSCCTTPRAAPGSRTPFPGSPPRRAATPACTKANGRKGWVGPSRRSSPRSAPTTWRTCRRSSWPSTSRSSARPGPPRGPTPSSATTWSTIRTTRNSRRCRTEAPGSASSTSATPSSRTRWRTSTAARAVGSPSTTLREGSSTRRALTASRCWRSSLRSARAWGYRPGCAEVQLRVLPPWRAAARHGGLAKVTCPGGLVTSRIARGPSALAGILAGLGAGRRLAGDAQRQDGEHGDGQQQHSPDEADLQQAAGAVLAAQAGAEAVLGIRLEPARGCGVGARREHDLAHALELVARRREVRVPEQQRVAPRWRHQEEFRQAYASRDGVEAQRRVVAV